MSQKPTRATSSTAASRARCASRSSNARRTASPTSTIPTAARRYAVTETTSGPPRRCGLGYATDKIVPAPAPSTAAAMPIVRPQTRADTSVASANVIHGSFPPTSGAPIQRTIPATATDPTTQARRSARERGRRTISCSVMRRNVPQVGRGRKGRPVPAVSGVSGLRETRLAHRILELGELGPAIANQDAPPAERDDLETDPVRIGEEGRIVVVGVLRVERRRRDR